MPSWCICAWKFTLLLPPWGTRNLWLPRAPAGTEDAAGRAVPCRGALLSSSAFGEGTSDGLEEPVTHRSFEHVRFASRLPWLFHFNNSQCRECAAGHGFMGAHFLPGKKNNRMNKVFLTELFLRERKFNEVSLKLLSSQGLETIVS